MSKRALYGFFEPTEGSEVCLTLCIKPGIKSAAHLAQPFQTKIKSLPPSKRKAFSSRAVSEIKKSEMKNLIERLLIFIGCSRNF
ncbi:hypothetical protein [Bacillus sp. ISL-55]|uniref:hypothetical protein n=1 Tax=Bacillus sp. ISL-55 TaxID=2819134 RepID=UPI001BE62B5D|nr:hypothetical protein [Bacillus sp. ISL-55]MBT2693150.1 hypothetical protein [Bacillus sp. ISL-55]